MPGDSGGDARNIRLRAGIRRKDPALPAYVEIPAGAVEAWAVAGTTTVVVHIAGTEVGRRSLKPWDETRWFVELPRAAMAAAGVAVGDTVDVTLAPASEELPRELARLIEEDDGARAAWEALSDSQKRWLREHVIAAKRSSTRTRRARKGLGLDA